MRMHYRRLLKNLSNAVIKTNVAPIDYKVIEL